MPITLSDSPEGSRISGSGGSADLILTSGGFGKIRLESDLSIDGATANNIRFDSVGPDAATPIADGTYAVGSSQITTVNGVITAISPSP